MERLFTIGHSTRSIAELIGLLIAHRVDVLLDVRAFPRSRRHPQFDREAIEPSLSEAGLAYRWEGRDLGGFRDGDGDARDIALAPGMFRAYAAHMRRRAFADAVVRVRAQAASRTCALMCAEADPAHCHRSFIADYLSLQGALVLHIRTRARAEPHRLHPRIRGDAGAFAYDGVTQQALDL